MSSDSKRMENEISSNLPVGWNLKELNALSEIVMGQSPQSSTYNKSGMGMPFLQGVRTFGRISPYIDTWTTNPIKIAKPGSILLSVRAPVGDVNLTYEEVCVGRGLAALNGQNNKFIFYLLKYLRQNLLNMETGTVFGAITKMNLGKMKVLHPPIEEQRVISEFLYFFDSKIELNNQMNKTLESIAQAIFKHWFIDFEFPDENGQPYKSSGGEMVESELGEIPKGFSTGKFGEIIQLKMGVSPKGETYNNNGIGLPLINGAADFSKSYIMPKKFTAQPARVCKKGDLLFCIRGTIGNLTFADKEYCLGRGVAAITANTEFTREFAYFELVNGLERISGVATGSVIIGLSKPDLLNFSVVLPNERILKAFHVMVQPLFLRSESIKIENQILASLRDSLLPKLMSGKIRVPLEDKNV